MQRASDSLSGLQKAHVGSLEEIGDEFKELCDQIGQSRELSLAKTKIEEAVMWAARHVETRTAP